MAAKVSSNFVFLRLEIGEQHDRPLVVHFVDERLEGAELFVNVLRFPIDADENERHSTGSNFPMQQKRSVRRLSFRR